MKSRASASAARERWGVAATSRAVRPVLFTLLAIALASAGTAAAQDAVANDIALPDKAVTKKILDNGLTLLVRASGPEGLVGVDVKIPAGVTVEGRFLGSGISHLVEHLVFKGTKTRGLGQIEREVKSYGGFINGSTSPDLTSYHLILPAQYLPQALEILKDMLLNAAFDEAEIAKEKEVVLSEIRMNEDEPQSRLIKRLNETAYIRHPYRIPPIGYGTALKALTRADIVEYYESTYAPNRIVVTIVGSVDAADALAKASAVFADFRAPRYAAAPANEPEPHQLDTRTLDEPSRVNLAYLGIGFHSTSILDADLYALDVLAMILGRGDNSRLNAHLVKDAQLAYSVSVWNATPRDPGLFTIYAMLDSSKASQAETAIRTEIDRLKTEPVSDAELATAKRMVLADFITSLQTVDGQADDIGESYILTGSPNFARRYVEGIGSVSKAAVQAAAAKYLTATNMSIVRLLPAASLAELPAAPKEPSAGQFRKEALPNGLRILVRRDTRTPIVSITAAMLGGLMAETAANNGISNLTAAMLLKGTRDRTEDRIQGFIEARGGSIASFSGFNAFGLKISVLAPDLKIALELLKDVLTNSTFPESEIEKEKALTLAAIRQEDDDIFDTGVNALRSAIFGASPYGLRHLGQADSIASLDRAALVDFAATHCVPNNMVISISGDIDPAAAVSLVKDLFSGLERHEISIPVPPPAVLAGPQTKEISMEKEQSLVLMGYASAGLNDPDRYTLEVISSVLSGFSGRLFAELRDRDPLAYTLGCFQKSLMGSGFFAFYVATTGENVETVKRGLAAQLEKIRTAGVSAEELAQAKRELRGARRIIEQTNDFFAFTAAVDELYGLGYDDLYRYDAHIEKVSAEEIARVAAQYLETPAHAEIVINPRQDQGRQ